MQIRLKGNCETKEVFIELNQKGKGVSLVNSDFTYKKIINVTDMFNSINNNEDVLQLDALYSAEKIGNCRFKIEIQLYL